MSNLNEKDIAKIKEQNGILGDLYQYKKLIEELSEKEIALYQWKEIYEIKAREIEVTTNFKEIYGKNNAEVRKQHIKEELREWHDNIKELEFSIDYITRRISFLKELIRTKRTLMEVKHD